MGAPEAEAAPLPAAAGLADVPELALGAAGAVAPQAAKGQLNASATASWLAPRLTDITFAPPGKQVP